ncbi:MAG: histidine kinase [Bacteroidia bacterium]|nr:histidine kinase [Bacteroidia bacterium]
MPFIFSDFQEGLSWERALSLSKPNISLFLAFLVNRFLLLPKLFFKQRRWSYVLAVLGLVVLIAFGTSLLSPSAHLNPPPFETINERPPGPPPLQGPGNPLQTGRPNRPFPSYLISSFLCLLIIGVDTGLNSFIKLSREEREHSLLKRENVSNQLAFLRNQVSPHFFMNTLNNIHALIDIDTTEAKESIIRLSRLMRHLLYDSEAEFLPLRKEVEFIESYVELMKLRYPSKVDILLEIPDLIPDKQIPPLLFTSMLENAFKYGISYSNPSFISISLEWTSNSLSFEISNSNHRESQEENYSGIGLQNTRKRLELLYAKHYILDVHDHEDIYTVNLLIPI